MRAEGALVRIKLPIIGLCWATTTDAAARDILKDDAHFARNPANAGAAISGGIIGSYPALCVP